MVRLGVIVALFALLGLAPTAKAQAPAQTPDQYQISILPGSVSQAFILVRMNITSGAAAVSVASQPFITITDATPMNSSVYRVYGSGHYDSGATTREWDVFRFDTQSGQVWMFVCCTGTPSWSEIVAGK